MSFNPEGSVAQQLKGPLMSELQGKFGIVDDTEDVAEFIMVLIGNNATPEQIVSDVTGLVDCQMDAGFITTVMGEIGRLQQQEQQLQQQVAQQPQSVQNTATFPPQVQMNDPSQVSVFQQQVEQNNVPTPSAFQQQVQHNQEQVQHNQELHVQIQVPPKMPSFHPMLSFPLGPKGKKPTGAGGIGKGKNNQQGKKLFGVKNAANLERALAQGNVNKTAAGNKPKGRCPDFPYCTNKECELAHPTKVCFAYPNCLNAPGTCNFLHPSEDADLMAKLEQLKKAYQEKKAVERAQKQAQLNTAIMPCKFGKRCSKEACLFGHPTPANEVPQQITQNEWCVWGRECGDPNCAKAHPSPNFDAAAAAAAKASAHPAHPASSAPAQPSLEQCKFGAGCTNFKCNKRHATTPVRCREGAKCTRLDCFFLHPIDEDCRFGANCTNKVCMFRHPEGRQVLETNTWRKEDYPGSTGRVFAVPEDEVMEQAVQN